MFSPSLFIVVASILGFRVFTIEPSTALTVVVAAVEVDVPVDPVVGLTINDEIEDEAGSGGVVIRGVNVEEADGEEPLDTVKVADLLRSGGREGDADEDEEDEGIRTRISEWMGEFGGVELNDGTNREADLLG